MHLSIKYLAAESLDYERLGVINVATAADYSFPGLLVIKNSMMKIGAKSRT